MPASQTTFARWTAIGALSPFMELHGRANLTPWTIPERPDETVALYRYWSMLHHELVPFFYSLAEEAYAGGPPLLDPDRRRERRGRATSATRSATRSWSRRSSTTAACATCALPAGARWYDWWAGDTTPPLDGGTDARRLRRHRSQPRAAVRARGRDPAHALVGARVAGARRASSFVVHDDDGSTTRIDAQAAADGLSATVTLSRAREATELRVRLPGGLYTVAVPAATGAQTFTVP